MHFGNSESEVRLPAIIVHVIIYIYYWFEIKLVSISYYCFYYYNSKLLSFLLLFTEKVVTENVLDRF